MAPLTVVFLLSERMEKIGKFVVRLCNGKPLGTRVMGSFLASDFRSGKLDYLIFDGVMEYQGLVSILSNDLPNNPTPCFLYSRFFS